jgi:hypothetical protein
MAITVLLMVVIVAAGLLGAILIVGIRGRKPQRAISHGQAADTSWLPAVMSGGSDCTTSDAAGCDGGGGGGGGE